MSTNSTGTRGTSKWPSTVIVMGVSGSGKSLIGAKLATALGGAFEDADDLHPPANKAKMSAGTPLTDDDRWPWLQILRDHITDHQGRGQPYVLACSALKDRYRHLLRGDDPPESVAFVYLKGSRELIGERIGARKGHFMPPALLDSQFAALEEPKDAYIVDVSPTPDEIVTNILAQFSGEASAAS